MSQEEARSASFHSTTMVPPEINASGSITTNPGVLLLLLKMVTWLMVSGEPVVYNVNPVQDASFGRAGLPMIFC